MAVLIFTIEIRSDIIQKLFFRLLPPEKLYNKSLQIRASLIGLII